MGARQDAGAPVKAGDLPTPTLLADAGVLERNVATMAASRPGRALRPHVKAFKCTSLAAELRRAGHTTFCCATTREVEGMVAAGLGDDLLLANEVVDATRLAALGAHVTAGRARITVAVDSGETIAAASAAGITEVLVDVDVGMPRCGCQPDEAGSIADAARKAGLHVRGVMGYEGHMMHEADRDTRVAGVTRSMAILESARNQVGGDVVSGGGTGSFDCNDTVTELQAGSYVLMDGDYARLGLPFEEGLVVSGTVVSVGTGGHAVLDAGLKALAMDSGPPGLQGSGKVLFCADEHTTVVGGSWTVGDRVGLRPAHIDPTISKHEQIHLVDDITSGGDAEVVETWPVDLRGW